MTRVLSAMLVVASLWPAVIVTPAGAQAGGCYSDAQVRTAVQQGQAVPLSNLIGAVQARFGGQVVSSRLCPSGGRLAYIVTLLVGGQVREVRVDATSGAIQ
jgi:uncharacterized membrane protein YkoI